MFRSFADVVMPSDLREYVRVPDISTGRRQIMTAAPTPMFKTYQQLLEARIKAIEEREGPAKPGDDILLSVITNGRHAAIDLRLVMPAVDIKRLVPTLGDAFTMTALGQTYAERRQAGRAVMKEILKLVQLQSQGEVHLASIGGFDLVFEGERIGKEGFHYQTLLQRTGATQEVDLAVTVTPLGAISRLGHALGGFEEEQQRFRRRLEEAHRRLASCRSRQGGAFAFADELKEKKRQLREVEEELHEAVREDHEATTQAASPEQGTALDRTGPPIDR